MPGKVIGRRTYLHVETLAALDEARREAWEQAVEQAEQSAGLERVKIKMRDQDVDLFGYGELFEPPFLYRKSRFINEEYPGYPEQAAFDEALEQLEARGLFSLAGYGPPAAELTVLLARHRWRGRSQGASIRNAISMPRMSVIALAT